MEWTALIVGSLICGALCASFMRGPLAGCAAAGIPFGAFSAWIIFSEMLLSHSGGGASLWPVALVVGGGAAALTGITAYFVCWLVRIGASKLS